METPFVIHTIRRRSKKVGIFNFRLFNLQQEVSFLRVLTAISAFLFLITIKQAISEKVMIFLV